jgi:hypothetical protein
MEHQADQKEHEKNEEENLRDARSREGHRPKA